MEDAVRLVNVGVVAVVVLAGCPVDTDVYGTVEHPAGLKHLHLLLDAALGATMPALALAVVAVFWIHTPVERALVRRERTVARVVPFGEPPRVLANRLGERFRRHVVAVRDGVLFRVDIPTTAHGFVAAAGERRLLGEVLRGDLLVRPAPVTQDVVEEAAELVEDAVADGLLDVPLLGNVPVLGRAWRVLVDQVVGFLGDIEAVLQRLFRGASGLELDVGPHRRPVSLPPLRGECRAVGRVVRVESHPFGPLRVDVKAEFDEIVVADLRRQQLEDVRADHRLRGEPRVELVVGRDGVGRVDRHEVIKGVEALTELRPCLLECFLEAGELRIAVAWVVEQRLSSLVHVGDELGGRVREVGRAVGHA